MNLRVLLAITLNFAVCSSGWAADPSATDATTAIVFGALRSSLEIQCRAAHFDTILASGTAPTKKLENFPEGFSAEDIRALAESALKAEEKNLTEIEKEIGIGAESDSRILEAVAKLKDTSDNKKVQAQTLHRLCVWKATVDGKADIKDKMKPDDAAYGLHFDKWKAQFLLCKKLQKVKDKADAAIKAAAGK